MYMVWHNLQRSRTPVSPPVRAKVSTFKTPEIFQTSDYVHMALPDTASKPASPPEVAVEEGATGDAKVNKPHDVDVSSAEAAAEWFHERHVIFMVHS